MKIPKATPEKILYISLVLILMFFIWKAYPVSNTLGPLNASDFSAHIFKISYISKNGITGWNPYWYGGFPFLKYYPPLSYLVAVSFSSLGTYLAYNLVFDAVWLLIPFCFFLFLKNINLSNIQRSISLLIFSLSPSILVFFKNGNLPFIVSFFFSIVFLIYLQKSFDKNSSVIKPIILLTAVLLSHVLMSVFLFISIILLFLTRWFGKKNLYKLLPILVIPGILATVWYLPFLDGIYSGREGGVSIISDPITYTSFTTNQRLNTLGIPNELFIIFSIFLVICFLFSFVKFKEKIFRDFFPWLVVSGILFILLDYKRIVVLMIIPLSVLISFNYKRKLIIVLILLNILVFSFFSINFSTIPTYPETGNRTIFYSEEDFCFGCSFYSVFLPETKGVEIINGWLPQSQNTNLLYEKRQPYLQKIQNPLSINYTEYNILIKSGMVNYIVVGKNPSLLEFFDKNPGLRILREENGFVIYVPLEKFSYIEIDNNQVEANISKSKKIEATFICSPGILTIKETYDRDLIVTLNGKKIDPSMNEYGFMKTTINETGKCNLIVDYKRSI